MSECNSFLIEEYLTKFTNSHNTQHFQSKVFQLFSNSKSIVLQLKEDAAERENKVSELETECSGLKERLAQDDIDHKTSIAEHERKFLQLSEEMGNKNSEVITNCAIKVKIIIFFETVWGQMM
jgi:predicted RNase H-like nuclease (RuvC/YqgF family)